MKVKIGDTVTVTETNIDWIPENPTGVVVEIDDRFEHTYLVKFTPYVKLWSNIINQEND